MPAFPVVQVEREAEGRLAGRDRPRRFPIEAKPSVALQFSGRFRLAVAFQISRRRAQDHVKIAQPARGPGAVRRPSDAQGDVDPPLHEVYQSVVHDQP